MAFSGKYELESKENYEVFMKAIETSDELIQKFKNSKSITEVVQDGNHFKCTFTNGNHVIYNEFTIGQEADFETLMGYKIKSVANWDGPNKIILQLNSVTLVTELIKDKLIDTFTVGDIMYKRISKRI
ncbi:fatty acid-binding protein 1, liver-like [Narcine bancroftii]|uniref:fatty acid-binding protein 1, liver-like n=1 Tax=Narcine bancroftii TaxID=1343680 RepID=UPI003831AD3F